jgi:magnesium transporter
VISVKVHTSGNELQNAISIAAISDVIGQADELIWIDVVQPTEDDLKQIRQEFAFHPLAIEDVVRQHQLPKVDLYDDYILIIFYGLREGATTSFRFPLAQVGIFVGSNYVVTFHNEHIPALDETSDRLCRNAEQLGTHGIALLLYSILDAVVDSYFPVLDDISDQLEALEERIFGKFDADTQKEIFRIRKQLLALRKFIAPERDVLNVLLRRDMPIFEESMFAYFQDIYDHILRVTDAIDTFRDVISSLLDFYLAAASNRLNQVVKTLTASSIILMAMTLIAGIYGMNFVHMPELRWEFGYAWALGLMALVGTSLLALFRRIGWI